MNRSIPKVEHDKSQIDKDKDDSATTSEAKWELLREKTAELEELTKIKQLSAQLCSHFEDLSQNIDHLSEGARGVAGVLSNWDYVFRTMGLVNTESGPDAKNPTIVNLPITSNHRQ